MEDSLSIELTVTLLTFIAWSLGIYQIIATETKDCIERIEKLKEWQKDSKFSKLNIEKVIAANRRPLNQFKKIWIRIIIIWIPTLSMTVATIMLLLYMALKNIIYYNITHFIIQSAFIILVFSLISSVIIITYAFHEHPEAKYIEVFLNRC